METTTNTEATARLRAEQALRESEQRYRRLFEDSVAFICTHKLDGTLLSINPAAAHNLGYTRDQGNDHSVRDFMPEPASPNFDAYLDRLRQHGRDAGEMHVVARDGSVHVWSYSNVVMHPPEGESYVIGHAIDITERRQLEADREQLIAQLQEALAKVKTLTGLLPICASCKKIRDDRGEWNHVESFIRERAEVNFSHGICPDCAQRLYPEHYKK